MNTLTELAESVARGDVDHLKGALKRRQCLVTMRDRMGRTLLHCAASFGETAIVQLLIAQGAAINAKDAESAYTPLHRALYHGQLQTAMVLIESGADLNALDGEGLRPSDLLAVQSAQCLGAVSVDNGSDSDDHSDTDKRKQTRVHTRATSVFSWGSSANLTLGHGRTDRDKPHAELVDAFSRSHMHDDDSIVEVSAADYHVLFRSARGRVYACGYGRGGRLGVDTEETSSLVPERVRSFPRQHTVVSVAAGLHHSIAVLDNGDVYTWGTQSDGQLGLPDVPLAGTSHVFDSPLLDRPSPTRPRSSSSKSSTVATPRLVRLPGTSKMFAAAASKIHSAVCSRTHLYTCGRNVGQLGHRSDSPVSTTFRVVSYVNEHRHRISALSVSDLCTAVALESGSVLVLHGHTCTSFIPPLQLFPTSFSVHRSESAVKPDVFPPRRILCRASAHVEVAVVSAVGLLYVWSPIEGSSARHVPLLASHREVRAADIAWCDHASNVLLVVSAHDGFLFSLSLASSSFAPLRRMPLAYHLSRLSADPRGLTFFALGDASPPPSVTTVDKDDSEASLVTLAIDLARLLDESFVGDGICDVTFTCAAGERVAAHAIVLASRGIALPSLFIDFPQTDATTVRLALRIVYSDEVDESITFSAQVLEALEFLRSSSLAYRCTPPFSASLLYPLTLPSVPPTDVSIRVSNSNSNSSSKSSSDSFVPCHRAVLVARCDYFRALFMSSFSDATTTTVSFPEPPTSITAHTVLAHLYTDATTSLFDTLSVAETTHVAVAAQSLCLESLSHAAQSALATRLDLANVVSLTHLAEFHGFYHLLERCCVCIAFHSGWMIESGAMTQLPCEIFRNEIEPHVRRLVGVPIVAPSVGGRGRRQRRTTDSVSLDVEHIEEHEGGAEEVVDAVNGERAEEVEEKANVEQRDGVDDAANGERAEEANVEQRDGVDDAANGERAEEAKVEQRDGVEEEAKVEQVRVMREEIDLFQGNGRAQSKRAAKKDKRRQRKSNLEVVCTTQTHYDNVPTWTKAAASPTPAPLLSSRPSRPNSSLKDIMAAQQQQQQPQQRPSSARSSPRHASKPKPIALSEYQSHQTTTSTAPWSGVASPPGVTGPSLRSLLSSSPSQRTVNSKRTTTTTTTTASSTSPSRLRSGVPWAAPSPSSAAPTPPIARILAEQEKEHRLRAHKDKRSLALIQLEERAIREMEAHYTFLFGVEEEQQAADARPLVEGEHLFTVSRKKTQHLM